jgi:sulfite reductase alpha subunit-like flavoprotein
VSTQILKEGAYVYICGKTAMATQVEETIIRIIRQYGEMNHDEAEMVFRNLKVYNAYKFISFFFFNPPDINIFHLI